MKIFISWSGNRSRDVAELLSQWLQCVIQAVRPWISTKDLDRGSLWFGEINDQLKETTIGIVCLTQENKGRPWILFEAGALAKGLSTSRVCTLLIDLEPKDLENPLAQFNHTLPKKESIHALVRTLNTALGPNALNDRILQQVFETYWPNFEKSFEEILANSKVTVGPVQKRSGEDVMGEILENTRTLSSRIRRLENQVERTRLEEHKSFMHPEHLKEQINYMLKRGAPADVVLHELRHAAPRSFLRSTIDTELTKLKEST